jgi:hypothetical protein
MKIIVLQFESVELGVRAADRTLKTYGKKHKINTVTGVIERFAPISDEQRYCKLHCCGC